MARRPRITEASVTELGVERLAALLVTEAAKNKPLKQALQLALESGEGAASLAAGIRQRLTSIGRSKSRLSTNKGREMIAELERLRASIVGDVADAEPAEALDLLWQLIDLHGPLIERTRDRAGRLGDFFRGAVPALPDLATRAAPSAERLAEQVFERFMNDTYDIYDNLIMTMAEPLRAIGIEALKARLEDASDTSRKKGVRQEHHFSTVQQGLRDVADISGDVDGFIETFSMEQARHPALAAEMATRLVRADRAQEALTFLDHAVPDADDERAGRLKWTNARLEALEKLGRLDEAKELNRQTFEAYLSPKHLKAYLKRLPDFDDMEAEESALDWVAQHSNFHQALIFLIAWPALPRAAKLISGRAAEIDGGLYEILLPAAEALDGRFPLAGALLRRVLIGHILKLGRAHRFKQALTHVRELEALDAAVSDYEDHSNHKEFMEQLWLDHPHKAGFWALFE